MSRSKGTSDVAAIAELTTRRVGRTGDRHSITAERTYDHPIDDVWEAWTDPQRLRRWLGEASGELEEGGAVRLVMSPPDGDVVRLEVLRCDRPRRLTARWSWQDEPFSIVDLHLSPDGGRTVLRLEHLPLPDDDASGYGAGWEDVLACLAAHLGGGSVGAGVGSGVEGHVTPIWSALTAASVADPRWPVTVAADGTSSITASFQLAAERPVVWEALTDTGHLAAWFADEISGDLRAGGTWTVAWGQGKASGEITTCDLGRSFTTTWAWAHDPADAVRSRLTITLTDVDGGTRLDLEQAGVLGPARGYAAGWHAHGRALAGHLAGRTRAGAEWHADWELAMAVLS